MHKVYVPLTVAIAITMVWRLAGERRSGPNAMPLSNSSIENEVTASAFGVEFEKLCPAELKGLEALAEKILEDPLALQQLSNRVYRLMQDDLHRQQDRQRVYGSSRYGR